MLIAAGLSELAILPLATAYVLAPHAPNPGHVYRGTWPEPVGTAVVFVLVLAATLPTVSALRAILAWWHARGILARIAMTATPGVARGISYSRLPERTVSVFTAGTLHPRIFVTEGAEALLSPDELHAALLHERVHVRQRDTAWLAAIAGLETAFGLVPQCRRAFAAMRLDIEHRADVGALRAGAKPLALFDAIVTASAPPAHVGAGLSDAGVLERLHWLAGEAWTTAYVDPTRSVTTTLGGWATVPIAVHALLWLGAICGLCSVHLW